MKTKYETPEINVLKLGVDDVIATSSGLKTETTWQPTTNGNSTWGDLWG